MGTHFVYLQQRAAVVSGAKVSVKYLGRLDFNPFIIIDVFFDT